MHIEMLCGYLRYSPDPMPSAPLWEGRAEKETALLHGCLCLPMYIVPSIVVKSSLERAWREWWCWQAEVRENRAYTGELLQMRDFLLRAEDMLMGCETIEKHQYHMASAAEEVLSEKMKPLFPGQEAYSDTLRP